MKKAEATSAEQVNNIVLPTPYELHLAFTVNVI